MLLTLMMLPRPLAAMPGANAATRKNGARTLLANILSNAEISNSAVGAKSAIPALLIRMSTSPTSRARRCTSAASPRSAATKLAEPPAAVIFLDGGGAAGGVAAVNHDLGPVPGQL